MLDTATRRRIRLARRAMRGSPIALHSTHIEHDGAMIGRRFHQEMECRAKAIVHGARK